MEAECVRYYCVKCKEYIPESEMRTVVRVPSGRVVVHQKCGGQVLYHNPVDNVFYVVLPQYMVVDAVGDEGR